jgi:O-antigen/teichoic acid export membrane protein
MDLSRRSSLLKINSVTSLVYQLVTLVCGFILPRLIIGYYGSAVNGLVSSITQFLGIISLCELGMGAVVPASLYKPLANKDNDAISRIIVSSEKFYRKIAVVMIIYVIGLTVFYPMIVKDFSFFYTSSLIIIIASSTFAQYFFGITNSLLITADQKQYITYCINGGTIVVNLILAYLLIKFECSIQTVKLVSSIIFITRPVLYTLYVKKHYCIDRDIKYEIEPIKQKWNGIAQHLAYTAQEKTGVVVLSFLSSLENISIYSVYFFILHGIRGLIYSVTSSLTSYLGNIIAKEEKETLTYNFLKIEWALHTITILFFSSSAILIVPFVSVYTSGISDANYLVPIFPFLLCAAIGFRCLQMPYNIVVQAAGHFKETQNSAIIEPIINIVLSVALVTWYGLSGVAFGMLVSIIYRTLYLSLYLTKHILYLSVRLLLKRLLVDALIVLAVVSVCSFIKISHLTYWAWIVMSIKVVTLATIITALLNFMFYKKLTVGFIENWMLKIKKIR